MAHLGRTARLTIVTVFAAVALVAAGCGSDVQGTAVAASGAADVPDVTTAPSSTRPTPSVPDTTDIDKGGDVDINVEIGDCVELGGEVDDATIDNATCGTAASNYVVIGKAPSSDLCISDADQYYYETLRGVEQGALCLDIDWQVGGCMDVSGDDPLRVDCATPGFDTRRVVEILQGSSDVNDCPDPATSGYEKDQRNFVVCVEEL